MARKILIDAKYPNETRVVLVDKNSQIEEIEYDTFAKHQIKGNIYLARVSRIEPSLQAAFINYGNEKSGFLPFNEIHPSYYNKGQKSRLPLTHIALPEITEQDIKEQESRKLPLEDDKEVEVLPENLENELINEATQDSTDSELNNTDTESEILQGDSVDQQEPYKPIKIQDVIDKNQVLLVQVNKESRGNKGASFTTYISLAGRYCILTPNREKNNGISKKITHPEEKRRLKSIVDNIVTPHNSGASLIIRTAGLNRTSYEIKKDCIYLIKLWNKIIDTSVKAKVPSFVHMEDDIIQKTIRDMYSTSVQEILIQGKEAFARAKKFMAVILPSEVYKVKEHCEGNQLFTKFNVEDQLSALYQPVVLLPSGGSLVINPTEALVAIDVNSGKATSENDLEETAVKINLEAAKEIVRQIKLRELSGLVIIDFIDMLDAKRRKAVERAFKYHISRDKAKVHVEEISSLGLLKISRQRLRPSFLESNSVVCKHCSGKGIVRANESNSMLMLRTIENEIHADSSNIMNIYAHADSITYILNNKRDAIKSIEDKYNIKLNFLNDYNATADSFSIEKVQERTNHFCNLADTPLISSFELLDSIETPETFIHQKANEEKLVAEEPTKNNTPNAQIQVKNQNEELVTPSKRIKWKSSNNSPIRKKKESVEEVSVDSGNETNNVSAEVSEVKPKIHKKSGRIRNRNFQKNRKKENTEQEPGTETSS